MRRPRPKLACGAKERKKKKKKNVQVYFLGCDAV
jgi:hypothetical protein